MERSRPLDDSPSSSDMSYSSESDQERASFIQKAKEAIEAKINKRFAAPKEEPQTNVEVVEAYDFQDMSTYYKGQKQALPGVEGFSQVIKANSTQLLQSLTAADKEGLYRLMPASVKDKDKLLQQILKDDKTVGAFGTGPLESFTSKMDNNAFTKAFQQFKN